MRRKVEAWPGAFDLAPLDRIWTIRAFDEQYTAPLHGFAGATDYYHKASAMRVIDRIRIPALILTAEDDPFVPGDQFRAAAIREQSVRHGARRTVGRPLRIHRVETARRIRTGPKRQRLRFSRPPLPLR